MAGKSATAARLLPAVWPCLRVFRTWLRSSGKDDSAPSPGPPGIEDIEFRVINIAANGPVVMTERVDVFKLPRKSFELQVMGIFEVNDGEISAWRDYFDMNQFTTRMG